MHRLVLSGTVLVVLTGLARSEAPKVATALKGLDPVELVGGKEVAGKEGLAAEYGRFRYLFATPANRAAFQKNPELYAVQFGGACARMGPLSGAGNPDRYFVFDKRIYLFASDSCLKGFKAAPELHVDKPDPVPKGTAAELKRGRELVELALKGFGGAKLVDDVKILQTETMLIYEQKDMPPFTMKKVATQVFPGKFHEITSYTGWSGVTAATPEGGFQTSNKLAWSMDPSVRDYFVREAYREPFTILRSRGEKSFVAVAGGKTKVGEMPVEELIVGLNGATTTLYVDLKTGRILKTAYRGRLSGPIGVVTKEYSNFESAVVTLPYTVATSFNGTAVTSPAASIGTISIDPVPDPKLFVKPD